MMVGSSGLLVEIFHFNLKKQEFKNNKKKRKHKTVIKEKN